jgi:glycosyltransferase involved in cell wall biosynthesis
MKIAFVYVQGRLARLADARAGRSAREFFYGALELQDRGHDVSLYEVDVEPYAPAGSLAVEWLYRCHLMPSKTNSSLIRQLRILLPELNACSVVVATASGPAYGLAVLSACGQLRSTLLAIHCGIANHSLRRRRRWINALLLRRSWSMLYGDGEVESVQRMFGVPTERLRVNQFGVDTTFWRPAEEKQDGSYILSVGNDLRRDYELLLALARRIDERFIIVTRQDLGQLPDNVEQMRGDWHAQALSDSGLRELYQKARLVIVPLKDSVQPSGQSVCLQAMACGKPVILTDTRGLWSREMMRDGENIVLTPPGDLSAMLQATSALIANPLQRALLGECARQIVCDSADIRLFSVRLEAFAKHIVNRNIKTC